MWIRNERVRRGLALGIILGSMGGLLLTRAHPAGAMSDPLLPMEVSTNGVTFSGPNVKGTFALSHSRVLANSPFAIWGELKLAADPESRAPQVARAPIAMAIVLDTSGSMAGEKIEEAKRSVARLIREMRDNDQVAFVRYSDSATTIQTMARVGDVRQSLTARVLSLAADGGTNIPSGLRAGRAALGESKIDYVKRVVLVSDGLDSTQEEAVRIASDTSESGVVVSSLGIGTDFDEKYMSRVASSGHGNFAYVKDGAALAQFLNRELTEAGSTLAEDIRVKFKLPSGVTFARARGAEATVEDGVVTVKCGSLFRGDERSVLLEFASTQKDGAKSSFPLEASWSLVGGGHGGAASGGPSVLAVSDTKAVDGSRDMQVWARAVSVQASERQLEAAKQFADGNRTLGAALAKKNDEFLKSATAAMPSSVAAPLAAQQKEYAGDIEGWGARGKGGIKESYDRDFQNMYRAKKAK